MTSQVDILRPLVKQIAKAFTVPVFQVESNLMEEPAASALTAFRSADGPLMVLLYAEMPAPSHSTGNAVDEEDEDPRIFVATGDGEVFAERGVLLLKNGVGVVLDSQAAVDAHVSCSVVLGSPFKSLLATLEHVFQPTLRASVGTWGSQLSEGGGDEFFAAIGKYGTMLSEAMATVEGGIELPRPSIRNTEMIEMKAPAYARAAQSSDVVASYEGAVEGWCDAVEALLNAVPLVSILVPEGDEGPSTELDYWKGRMQRFASVHEQLRARESKVILGVLGSTRSLVMRRWKGLDAPLTDATNEARDNTKYLTALEKFLEPLALGSPSQMADCLPGFLSNVKMMHTMSRYYCSEERLTTLLCKLTNQLVVRCVAYLEEPGKLWSQRTHAHVARAALSARASLLRLPRLPAAPPAPPCCAALSHRVL